jgi:hypothetical protein
VTFWTRSAATEQAPPNDAFGELPGCKSMAADSHYLGRQ